MRILPSLLLLVPLAFAPGVASALDAAQVPTAAEVANAYAAIPHRRTHGDHHRSRPQAPGLDGDDQPALIGDPFLARSSHD